MLNQFSRALTPHVPADLAALVVVFLFAFGGDWIAGAVLAAVIASAARLWTFISQGYDY